jgi:hypothetical protein
VCTRPPRCRPVCTTTRLAAGFSKGYLLSAGILALAMIIALAVIPVSRHDLPAGDADPSNLA